VSAEEKNEAVVARVWAHAGPLLADMGMELVEVEFRRESGGWVLRLYIDRDGGVSVEDCAQVSREVSVFLDVEDMIDHAYNLEVSSPGLERPLRKAEDFARFAGRRVRVKMAAPLEGRRVFTGTLRGMEAEDVVVELDEGVRVRLPRRDVARARLVV